MKRPLVISAAIVVALCGAGIANAQMTRSPNAGVSQEIYEHTLREEAEGQELWMKLRENKVLCAALSADDFGVLGEYFMGQMTGDSHPAMNAMMIQMHGEEGEEQIHVVMGKRLSGCETAAAFPSAGAGWMPMMNMMWGGWASSFGPDRTGNPMTRGLAGSWPMTLSWMTWLVVGILAAVWLWKLINKK